jgi:hypothetical protein
MTITANSFDFLGIAQTLLDRAALAYRAYMHNGRVFLYARIMKDSNDQLREVMIQNTHILPPAQRQDALALIHHIDVWSAIWEQTFSQEKPALNSAFVFENSVNFPSKEVARLMAFYLEHTA